MNFRFSANVNWHSQKNWYNTQNLYTISNSAMAFINWVQVISTMTIFYWTRCINQFFKWTLWSSLHEFIQFQWSIDKMKFTLWCYVDASALYVYKMYTEFHDLTNYKHVLSLANEIINLHQFVYNGNSFSYYENAHNIFVDLVVVVYIYPEYIQSEILCPMSYWNYCWNSANRPINTMMKWRKKNGWEPQY